MLDVATLKEMLGKTSEARFEAACRGLGHEGKELFAAAGLPYSNLHMIRKTLVRLGEQRCRTPEEFKAWSQNLGHEQVMTTFTSYGNVPGIRQAAILSELGQVSKAAQFASGSDPDPKTIAQVVEYLQRRAS